MTYEELKREMEKYPETMSQGERAQKYAAGETVDQSSDILQLSGEMTSRSISMSLRGEKKNSTSWALPPG